MIKRGDEFDREYGQFIDDSLSPLVVAAHELKSPLGLIRQLAFELEQTETLVDTKYLAEQIRLVSERSLRLTTNLTKTANLQESLFPLQPLNVLQVCESVRRELSPLYRAHGRRLSFYRSMKLPLVVANQELLHRVLASFVDNALHYSDEESTVEVFTKVIRKNDRVRVGVRDYGPSQAPSRPESSGLGLHIAGQFAQSLGGRMGAIRHKDGASFYVDVPISKQLALI